MPGSASPPPYRSPPRPEIADPGRSCDPYLPRNVRGPAGKRPSEPFAEEAACRCVTWLASRLQDLRAVLPQYRTPEHPASMAPWEELLPEGEADGNMEGR